MKSSRTGGADENCDIKCGLGHLHRIQFAAVAIVWAIIILPGLDARYSFGWDSSQFDRAVADFDIMRHQPHPPGYPLLILALRGVTPVLGNPNRAQVFLALLFTVGGLWFFYALGRKLLGDRAALAVTSLLAFSPVTCLNANSSQVYAVDLFLSCFAGWAAAKLWSGKIEHSMLGFAILGVGGGFRPSGPVLLLPLMCIALWRCGRTNRWRSIAALLAGGICWLAWWTPTALYTGGFRALAALNHNQMIDSFSKTSVFYGAPALRHARMIVEVCLYYTVALCGFVPVLVAVVGSRRQCGKETPARVHPSWATPGFFALWMTPNLALVFLLHCSQPGYILLSLPPLALFLAWSARRRLNGLRWLAAGVVTSLLVSYFPYEWFMRPTGTNLPFLLLRATPRISALIETSQNDIRTLIDAMPGRPEERLVFCLRSTFEAPNIRTVTYDFSDVTWAALGPLGVRTFSRYERTSPRRPGEVRSVGWVADSAGLPPDLRAKFPHMRQIAGNALYSFWTGPTDKQELQAVEAERRP